jgi:hypothetical protein
MGLRFKTCLAALFVIAVSGCAFTDSTVKIDYKPSKGTPAVGVKETISVEKFADQRGMEPNVLAYKGVQVRTSGRYLCDREVSAVVTDATKTLLAHLGYSVVDEGGDYQLLGDLLKYDSAVIMGFWSGQLEGTAQVSLKLRGKDKNNIVWSEMLTGRAKKTGLQIDSEEHRKDVAEGALDDLMQKISESQSLRKALEAKGP